MDKLLHYIRNSLTVPGQIRSLDGLRALAILLVLITHTAQHIPGISFVAWYTEWASPIYNGWMGVDLFFVLSGFLISSAIIKSLNNNNFSLIGFYQHRSLRILPAYFFMLIFILSINQFFPNNSVLEEYNLKDIIFSFMLLTDYLSSKIPIPSWSLSIEEHFYLLLPCFLILCRNNKTRIKVILFLIFAALFFRIFTYRAFSMNEAYPIAKVFRLIYFPFHTRMDALAVGVLVGILYFLVQKREEDHIQTLVISSLGFLLVGFVFVGGALQGGFFNTTIQYSLVCLGFGGILWGALANNKLKTFLSRPFWTPIARVSYSVYLTHFFTLNVISAVFKLKLWMFLLVMGACFIAAIPLYLLVEYPFHQLAKRISAKVDNEPNIPLATSTA